MKKLLMVVMVLAAALAINGQAVEPEYIGEASIVRTDGTFAQLDKEIGDFSSGWSWSNNTNKAFWLEVIGGQAKSRFKSGDPLQLVVRAVDNNSDPLTIVSIYKFKANKKKRSVVIAKDNSGTFLKSRTVSKGLVRFSGKKYGTSSYMLSLTDLAAGEYGIVVSNPNNVDGKRTVVSCFAIE